MKLNENIKELRKQRNLRQEQLAEAMGVSTASVSKWETGQCTPELSLLIELAGYFEVSIDTLVGYTQNADRMELLISQMRDALTDRDEDTASSLCEKLLRNYSNNDRVVEACANGYYQLFICTNKKKYLENCLTQTKRLMYLKQGESERDRLDRISALGNLYFLSEQWNTAKEYYEQSNVMGSNNTSIAECLLKQGQVQEALAMLSNDLLDSVFYVYQTVLILADGWIAMGNPQKALAALEWMETVMTSLHYAPTIMVVILTKMAELYDASGQKEEAKKAVRRAAELTCENNRLEFYAAADFLQTVKASQMLVSTSETNQDLLINAASTMGDVYKEIALEVLR